MTIILLAIIILLCCALLYAHRKHQDTLAVLTAAFDRIAEKIERKL